MGISVKIGDFTYNLILGVAIKNCNRDLIFYGGTLMTKKEQKIVKEQLKVLFNKFIKHKNEYKNNPSTLVSNIELTKQEARLSGLLDFIVALYAKDVEIFNPEDLYPMLDALKANTEIL